MRDDLNPARGIVVAYSLSLGFWALVLGAWLIERALS